MSIDQPIKHTELPFQLIVESTPNAMILVNKEGKITFANFQTGNLFGYNKSELLGQPVEILRSPRFSANPHFTDMFFVDPKIILVGEEEGLSAIKKDGTEFPVEASLSPIVTADGVQMLLAIFDITERKKFQEQQNLFASIINSSDDAIISKNMDGIITSWNNGAVKVFGYTAEEAIGKHISILIPPDLRDEEKGIMAKIRKGEYVDHYETDRIRKDGSKINVTLSISPIKDAFGNIVGSSKISRNITERKEFEKGRLKSEFLANMSHELRTPMNAILGFSELLIDKKVGELNAKQVEYLNDIHNSGSHLLRLINDVLDLAKIESGKMALEVETFSISETVKEVINVVNPLAQKKRITIALNLSGETDMVTLDKNKFRQILYNLLSNAIKFNNPNGTINMETKSGNDNTFTLQVKDSGIGIAKENLDKLFLPFIQLDSGSTRKHEGSGLGLSLTKNIIELHNGAISVESVFGKGTAFNITLPVKYERK